MEDNSSHFERILDCVGLHCPSNVNIRVLHNLKVKLSTGRPKWFNEIADSEESENSEISEFAVRNNNKFYSEMDFRKKEPSQFPETHIHQPLPPHSQNYPYQNQNPPQQNYFQNQQQYQYSQNYYQNPPSQDYHPLPPQSQNYVYQDTQYYVPDTSHFRETQPQSSDEEELEANNEDDDEEESSDETQPEYQPQQQAQPKRSYVGRQKRKNWVEVEEVALSKAFIQCSVDKIRGNQKSRETLWKDIIKHFLIQIPGSDRSKDQLYSKWGDLLKKLNKFNCIFNRLNNRPVSGRSDVDLLQAARSEYLKLYKKAFPHEAAWGVLMEHSKCDKVGEYTSGLDARFSAHSTGTPEEVNVEREEEEEVLDPKTK
ncbi:hypothetical protein LXL04_033875 [Taraxacum kok-saghyz]